MSDQPPDSSTDNASSPNSKWAVAILLLAAVVIIGVLYSNMSAQRELADSYRDRMEFTEEALLQAQAEQGEESLALREAERRAAAAEEARRMMSDAELEVERSKAKELAELNERLERESLARAEAEDSLADLREKAERLNALLEAGDRSSVEGGQSLASIREEVRLLNQEISEVEAMALRARERQMDMEQSILEGGDDITLENYRILSPNYKRQEAVLWQERH